MLIFSKYGKLFFQEREKKVHFPLFFEILKVTEHSAPKSQNLISI